MRGNDCIILRCICAPMYDVYLYFHWPASEVILKNKIMNTYGQKWIENITFNNLPQLRKPHNVSHT